MQSQGKPVAKTSTGGVILMVVGIIATIFLVVGAVFVAGIAAIVDAFNADDGKPTVVTTRPQKPPAKDDDDDDDDDKGKPASSANLPALPPRAPDAGAARLSKGVVDVDDEFDMADAARVTQSHYPEVNRCFAASQKWTGELVLTVTVRTRDGHAMGSNCKTHWHESSDKTKKLPKLDPRASEFCGCVQTQTPSWVFAKPKDYGISQYDPDNTTDLDVVYVAE